MFAEFKCLRALLNTIMQYTPNGHSPRFNETLAACAAVLRQAHNSPQHPNIKTWQVDDTTRPRTGLQVGRAAHVCRRANGGRKREKA